MRARDITLTEFTNTFVPFALFVSMALLAAEATQDLAKYRMINAELDQRSAESACGARSRSTSATRPAICISR